MAATVSCNGDDSVTNTDQGSDENGDRSQLQTQWSEPLTLHRFEVEWLSDLNESFEATIAEEHSLTITGNGEGFFYLLIPNIEPGRYAVEFEADGSLFEFDLVVNEPEELENEDQYVDDFLSGMNAGHEMESNSELNQALNDLDELDDEERTVAVRFFANNHNILDNLLSSLSEISAGSSASIEAMTKYNIQSESLNPFDQAVIVLEAGSSVAQSVRAMSEIETDSPGINAGLALIKELASGLLPAIDRVTARALEQPVLPTVGKVVWITSSSDQSDLEMKFVDSQNEPELVELNVNTEYSIAVDEVAFRTIRASDNENLPINVATFKKKYETLLALAANTFTFEFSSYIEEVTTRLPDLNRLSVEIVESGFEVTGLEHGDDRLFLGVILADDNATVPAQTTIRIWYGNSPDGPLFEGEIPVELHPAAEREPFGEWVQIDTGSTLDVFFANDIHFSNEQNGWIVGRFHGDSDWNHFSAYTTDGGDTWTLDEGFDGNFLGNLSSVYTLDSGRTFAPADLNGYLLYRDPGDTEWSRTRLNNLEGLDFSASGLEIQFVNDQLGWMAGRALNQEYDQHFGVILHTQDGGETWYVQQAPEPEIPMLTNLYFLDEQTGWASGSRIVGQTAIPVMLHTNDGGETWTEQTDGIAAKQHFMNRQIGWGVSGRTVYKTYDGGQIWNSISSIPDGFPGYGTSYQAGGYSDIHFINKQTGWVVGRKYVESTGETVPAIQRSDDGGRTWKLEEIGGQDNKADNSMVRAMHFIDDEQGWAVGSHGEIYRFEVEQ